MCKNKQYNEIYVSNINRTKGRRNYFSKGKRSDILNWNPALVQRISLWILTNEVNILLLCYVCDIYETSRGPIIYSYRENRDNDL